MIINNKRGRIQMNNFCDEENEKGRSELNKRRTHNKDISPLN